MPPPAVPVSWFSQPGAGTPAAPAATPVAATVGAPPSTPVIGGVGPSGLPLRVPMAQLPVGNGAAPVPAPRDEADPDAVSSLLNRFYGGVRRAESENPSDQTSAPPWRGEREQR